MSASILVLGTADWNQAIATNQHYVVRELAGAFAVTFVESAGLRRPELNMRDLRRVTRRLRSSAGREMSQTRRPIPPSVDIRSPLVIPRHVGLVSQLNRQRMRSLVSDWLRSPMPRVMWTFTPVTYGLEEHASSIVYHCVDLLAEVEGISSTLIVDAERNLATRSTLAIGTSPVVASHLRACGFEHVELWPNVADIAVVGSRRPSTVQRSPQRAVFAGNLSNRKVDFNLLGALIDQGIDLHLAGPVDEGGGASARELRDLVDRGAVHHGLLDLRHLADLYWTAEIGLIPYTINSYTRGVSPLKTYEYLAAGLSVVSTAVPSVEEVPGHVAVAPNHERFVHAALTATATRADAAARERIAAAHSWSERGDVVRSLAARLWRGEVV